MAKNLPPPSSLSLEGNLKENFRRFKQQFEIYMSATEIAAKEDEVKTSTLLHVIGPDAIEIFNTFQWTEPGDNVDDKTKVDKVLAKFEKYCSPKKNVVFERHIFNTRKQGLSEKVDTFVTDLKILARSCEFENLHDSLIRDRIVCGINSDTVRGRLLRESELTLQKAIDICRAAETSSSQLHVLSMNGHESTVNFVRKGGSAKANTGKTDYFKSSKRKPATTNCGKCGRKHEARNCPAFGKQCHKCKGKNHFAKMCKSRHNPKVHTVEPGSSDSEQEFSIDAVETADKSENNWTVTVSCEDKKVKMKIDTGAQCNVMSKDTYKSITRKQFQKSKTRLVSYSGHRISTLGKAVLTITHKGKFYATPFHIVDRNVVTIIGSQSSLDMDMVKRVYAVNTKEETTETIMNHYSELFEGIGRLNGEYKIRTDDSVQPVVHPPRKIPFALKSKVKQELDRMKDLKVIEKVNQPTNWVNSMVVVEKRNKKVRICIDPRDLNRAIKREHYPMKTVDDVAVKLSGAKIFSTLDASSGFWAVVLDEESSLKTTFNTPFGRYKYLRMPFGICSAPEVFQKKVSQIFENIEGCEVIMDDILIWGNDEREHNERLKIVLETAKRANLKLNKNKSKIGLTEVKYMGHLIGKDGLKTDPEKVKAIHAIPEPQNKKELQRFMGMVNYVSKFIKNLSMINQPLRILLEKDIAWHWDTQHQKAFIALKDALSEAPVLKFFDPSKDVVLSVDASSEGLGAYILQEGHPVAYASRSLNKAERNYAQIEKELLAVVFGCTRFHQFVYGKQVHVESDHKPLESLFRKTLSSAPPRIQRMMLKVQKYDLDLRYKAGKELYVADTLSRAADKVIQDEKDQFEVFFIENLPITDAKIQKILDELPWDVELMTLKQTILSGWPSERSKCDISLLNYWNFREELTVQDGLIMKNKRIIIPSSLRTEMLEKLHYGHAGIEKCRMRARDVLYWPGINKDISDMISKCAVCNENRNRQQKEPMIPHEVPDRPWQKIGVDLFELAGQKYVLMVDYYSKFFELSRLSNEKSGHVIDMMKPHFARHGIPDICISDNAMQFCSSEFKAFAKLYGFKHITSSPRYPQSNGFVERNVQTVKSLLKKAKREKRDPYLAMLEYRNTPIGNLGTPSQLLMGRRTKGLLPIAPSLLKPSFATDSVKHQLQENQKKQKHYYDRLTKSLPELQPGDSVRINDGHSTKPLKPGKVIQKTDKPRSYIVSSDGVQYRRNRRDLIKTKDNEIECDETENNDDIHCEQNEQIETDNINDEVRTRSGRLVKLPSKYQDFQMNCVRY